ncbi:MAG: phosphate ABC transporter permease PstA [Anaerolineae bacterium]|nr:phosphate ABC transporter permease PstA [Anaerolineae bacterium]
MRNFFFSSLIISFIALIVLVLTILNQVFGLVAVEYAITPSDLSERPLEELNTQELVEVLETQGGVGPLRVLMRDSLSRVPTEQFTSAPLSEVLRGSQLPEGSANKTVRDLTPDEIAQILATNLSSQAVLERIRQDILKPSVQATWTFVESVFNRERIEITVEDRFPDAVIEWRSWLNLDFVVSSQSTNPAETGIAPALLGSLWLMGITILIAFPLGVGAAIYLEEYAKDSWLNKLIETNIRNLAGVPSIIYGMLGLAIFVRALEPITSGAAFGLVSENGRTIISAALTLSLLILPILIINAQEALRAVPSTIREASFGLGATKWQTISRQILPAALPGIMTGTILALSRAVGETAPLIVVGAAAYINANPDNPFVKFTALPILVYNWTGDPNDQFRNIAAAAIIVLLIVLLTMNSTAIFLRNRAVNRRV